MPINHGKPRPIPELTGDASMTLKLIALILTPIEMMLWIEA